MLIRAYNRRRNLAVLLAKEQEAQGSQAGDGHTGNGDQREVVRRLRDGCRRLGGRGRCTVGRGVVRRVICGIVGRTLWLIILVKLFIMFFILKIFFFPDFLGDHPTDADKGTYVGNELIQRALPEKTTDF